MQTTRRAWIAKQRATELAALASEGYTPAQYQFALLHQLGIPDAIPSASKVRVPGLDGLEWRPNDVEAVRYFRMAAEQNYAPAMVGLAAALEAGKGVEQDTGEALAFYELAAEKGDLHGKWGLADMLLDGRGAPADWGRGLGLLTEVASASSENYEAQAELARRYVEHPGADLRVAYMWYAVAAHEARGESLDGLADDHDQARLRLEPLMSSGEIDTAKAMAGTCLSTSYRRCRPPELLDGLTGLFGY